MSVLCLHYWWKMRGKGWDDYYAMMLVSSIMIDILILILIASLFV
jgi:hypothetical protein